MLRSVAKSLAGVSWGWSLAAVGEDPLEGVPQGDSLEGVPQGDLAAPGVAGKLGPGCCLHQQIC